MKARMLFVVVFVVGVVPALSVQAQPKPDPSVFIWNGAGDPNGSPPGSDDQFENSANWLNVDTGLQNDPNNGIPDSFLERASFRGNGPLDVLFGGDPNEVLNLQMLDFHAAGYTLGVTTGAKIVKFGNETKSKVHGLRFDQGTLLGGTVVLNTQMVFWLTEDETRVRVAAGRTMLIKGRITEDFDLSLSTSLLIDGEGTKIFTRNSNNFNGGNNLIRQGITYVNNSPINPNDSGLGRNQVLIQNDGTLAGTGQIALSTGKDILVQGNVGTGAFATLTAGFEDPNGNPTIGTLTFTQHTGNSGGGNDLQLQPNHIIEFQVGATADLIIIPNGVNVDTTHPNGNGTGSFNILAAPGAAVGTYTLIDYAEAILFPGGSLTLDDGAGGLAQLNAELSLPSGWVASLVDNGANTSIDLVVTVVSGGGGLDGDFDGSGVVDGEDFLLWQRGGSPVPLSSSDLALWEANYGASALTATSTAIPEPSSVLLVVAGSLFLCVSRKARIAKAR